jgi:asparagine N-glycosylation enzyme membrane subunit Stt3
MMARNAGQPLLDRHSWRQVDTASFARGLAKGSFDVFHVRFLAYYPDEFGIGGPVETEFNLYPLIVSVLYRLFGVHEVLARLVSIAFALGTAIVVYALGNRIFGRMAGMCAALALGLSPLYVFYSRTVQPESTVLFLSVGGLWFFMRWLDTEDWLAYVVALLCTMLALLTKITSLYMALPLLVAAWLKFRWRLLRQWPLWLYALGALLPAGLYYLYAHSLYQQSGMTVYGISGGWPGSGKFDNLSQWLSADFYRILLTRLRTIILGNYCFLLLLVGLALAPKTSKEWVLYSWLGAVGVFTLAVAQGNRQHEYYQLPIVPVAALFIGKALSALAKPGALDLDVILLRRHAGAVLAVLLIGLSLRAALRILSPMYAQATVLLEVAEATQRLTPEQAPVAILHDWARVPEVFYYAHRRGWSLWLERTPSGEYDRLIISVRERAASGWRIQEKLDRDIGHFEVLRSQGASSLVVSLEKGTREEFLRSPIGRALGGRYPLVGSAEHWIIYDLRHTTGDCGCPQ